MVLVASSVGTALPAARYTSYDAAFAEAGQLSLADVCDGNTEPFAGDILVTQAGNAAAAVENVVALDAEQAVFAPLAFLGAIYQLYNVPAVKPLAL